MSLSLKKVVIGLPDETYRALRVLAEVHNQDLGEAGRVLLTECLLGKAHALKVVAARFARATKEGNDS